MSLYPLVPIEKQTKKNAKTTTTNSLSKRTKKQVEESYSSSDSDFLIDESSENNEDYDFDDSQQQFFNINNSSNFVSTPSSVFSLNNSNSSSPFSNNSSSSNQSTPMKKESDAEFEEKKKQPKKRARKELPPGLVLPPVLKSVVDSFKLGKGELPQLSRQTLLKLSSPEMQLYSKELVKIRTLTKEEKLLLKKQKRLVKNRESAQQSRQKKRDHVEYLEGIINGLKSDMSNISNEKTSFQIESQNLKNENKYLKDYVNEIFSEIQQQGISLTTETIMKGNSLGFFLSSNSQNYIPQFVSNDQQQQQQQQQQIASCNTIDINNDFHAFIAPDFNSNPSLNLSFSSLPFMKNEEVLSIPSNDGSDSAYTSDSSENSPYSPFGANWRSAGTCLMVVVLLFGLFNFNGNMNSGSTSSVLTSNGIVGNMPNSRVLHSVSPIANSHNGIVNALALREQHPSIANTDILRFDEYNLKRASEIRKHLTLGENATYLLVNDVTTLSPLTETPISMKSGSDDFNESPNGECVVGVVLPYAALSGLRIKLNNSENHSPNDLIQFKCSLSQANIIDMSSLQQKQILELGDL